MYTDIQMQEGSFYQSARVIWLWYMTQTCWKISRVTKLITGKDDQVRGVVLRAAARKGAGHHAAMTIATVEIHCSSSK